MLIDYTPLFPFIDKPAIRLIKKKAAGPVSSGSFPYLKQVDPSIMPATLLTAGRYRIPR